MSGRSRSQSFRMNLSMRSRSHSSLRQTSSDTAPRHPKSASASRSGSRSGSPAPSRRVAKLNMYLARSAATSTPDLRSTADAVVNPPQSFNVKRWDGNCRTTMNWDSIRKVSMLIIQECRWLIVLQDSELWYASGDCLVYFYERGSSKRGASLKVSLVDIQESNCEPLLRKCYGEAVSNSPSNFSESSDYFQDPYPTPEHGMYIPAPTHLSREEAYQYHLTTRNFFAWVCGKPLVGDRLGSALISLLERMNEYRPDPQENQNDILAHMDDQGYTDFRDCPDHSLAVLQFAEVFQCRELWTDAFVHCAGMNDQLDTSAEFEV